MRMAAALEAATTPPHVPLENQKHDWPLLPVILPSEFGEGHHLQTNNRVRYPRKSVQYAKNATILVGVGVGTGVPPTS